MRHILCLLGFHDTHRLPGARPGKGMPVTDPYEFVCVHCPWRATRVRSNDLPATAARVRTHAR